MKKIIMVWCILFCIISLNEIQAQHRTVSLTFDDLPATHGDFQEMQYITQELLRVLTSHEIPAIGFVNESKLHINGKPDSSHVRLLSLWLEAGMDLGNHTYSHVYIDQTPLEEYKKEVIRGEQITRPLLKNFGKELVYYRHTQLRTGPTEDYRRQLNAFLKEKGYTVAPVTIDNDEFIYAYCYVHAKRTGDFERMQVIQDEYLAYMERIFQYYEQLSFNFLGYEPRQTLLLHANMLNADVMTELVGMIKNRGYSFISLGEALEDEAYDLPVVQSNTGLSWLHRWMIADGMDPAPQPEPSQQIMDLFHRYAEESR